MRHSSRKSRKTFSLSRDAAAYLETYRVKRKEPSLSAAVEALIRERKEQEEADRLAAQTSAYYESLSPGESGESEDWAEFAESELARSEG